MEAGLTGELMILGGVWVLVVGVYLLFLRGSSEGVGLADRIWKRELPPPLESIAGIPSEKRLYQRKRLPWTVSYSVLERPECRGTTLSKDISKGGVCIPLPVSLERGSRLHLSIQLPKSRRPLSVWGEVMWQGTPVATPKPRFETGIRFIELDPSRILRIAQFL